uniref:Uncharacterized protein n=1 Tax=Romanomermis culicivorax TaxID=13658 RepID=A0A915HZV0_ROMCU
MESKSTLRKLKSHAPQTPKSTFPSRKTSEISFVNRSCKQLPSCEYNHFPEQKSYLLGPENGDESQICLLGVCLLITKIPPFEPTKLTVKTPIEWATSMSKLELLPYLSLKWNKNRNEKALQINMEF